MDGVKPRLSSQRRPTRSQPGLRAGISLNSSPLLRLLAGWGVAEVAPPALSLAERWSPWLAWTDAITLSAVLGAGVPVAAAGPRQAADVAAAISAVKRLRQALTQAIDNGAGLAAGAPDEPGLAGLRRQYLAQQCAMDEAIAPVRTQVRAALTGQGSDLARLAALDVVLDEALAARQRRLLATVPAWLEKSVKRASASLPAASAQMQRALLAELDLRLQPIEGLVDALARGPA